MPKFGPSKKKPPPLRNIAALAIRGFRPAVRRSFESSASFAADDHRTFNRHGEAFDAGETFSGVDFDTGVDAAREFAALAPAGATPAQAALRWVIQQPGVSTVIPGARNPEQAAQNAAAAGLPPFSDTDLAAIADLYDRRIRAQVHDRW